MDGLRLSEALVDDRAGFLIRVTVNYLGETPSLFPFAFISDDRISRNRLKLLVSTANSEHDFSLNDPTIPLRGRFEPLVVPMISHASYVLGSRLSVWRAGFRGQEKLEAIIGRQAELWVELDCQYLMSTAMPPLACPLYGYPNSNAITCWQDKLTSTKLRLPQ